MPLIKKGNGGNFKLNGKKLTEVGSTKKPFTRRLSADDKLALIEEYHGYVVQEKLAQSGKERLREKVMDAVKEFGNQINNKTITLEFDGLTATVTKASKTVVKEGAEDILKEAGVLRQCQKMLIDTESVLEQFRLGKLSKKQLFQTLEQSEMSKLTVASKKK